jgi:hypothetical protein
MTLDTLITQLENIRREAGTGNLQVLFREPSSGYLFDEIYPTLSEVGLEGADNMELFDTLDLCVDDFYVEI